jgi:hypothetical protein
MLFVSPAARFTDANGRTIFAKIERSPGGFLGVDLTWRTALGAIIWIGNRCFYAPLFFWRKPR